MADGLKQGKFGGKVLNEGDMIPELNPNKRTSGHVLLISKIW